MMMNYCVELWTSDAAFRYVRQFLVASNYGVVSPIIPENFGLHCVLRTTDEHFYCLFKKARKIPDEFGNIILRPNWFWKFPEFFKEFLDTVPDLNGAGESINIDCLERAIHNGYTLLYVYGDGSIYTINPSKIWEVHKRALIIYPSEGLMRTQDKTNERKVAYGNGVKQSINEATLSFPVKLLVRMK